MNIKNQRFHAVLAAALVGTTVAWIPSAASAADGGDDLAAPKRVELRPVWAGIELNVPVQVAIPPDGSGRLFLVQQRGQIMVLPPDRASDAAEAFLDLSGRDLEAHKFEEGLLGICFHPGFAENGRFFTYHTEQKPKRSLLTGWRVEDGAVDPDSEQILMDIPQPYWNHNSGNMLFGPDGLFYLAVGDGGSRGDPMNHGQNTFSLLGKILRIDVDGTHGVLPYGIPEDNPFFGKEGHRWEIYALGLRNPWGMYFDADGDLWAADVGQDLWEEINLIKSGANYGWNFREGTRPFPQRPMDPPAEMEFEEPIHEYTRHEGISITGGVIYQGERRPDLVGRYIYGDWGTGRIWALEYDKEKGEVVANDLLFEVELDERGRAGIQPSAFNFDENGEILVLCWRGAIYEMH